MGYIPFRRVSQEYDTAVRGLCCTSSPRLAESIYVPMEIHEVIDLSAGHYPRAVERMMASLASIAKYRRVDYSSRCNCKPFALYR